MTLTLEDRTKALELRVGRLERGMRDTKKRMRAFEDEVLKKLEKLDRLDEIVELLRQRLPKPEGIEPGPADGHW